MDYIVRMSGTSRNKDFSPELKSKIKNIQLVLWGSICIISGTAIYKRQSHNEETVCMILFYQTIIKQEIKETIYNFISTCIQETIRKNLDAIGKESISKETQFNDTKENEKEKDSKKT